MKRIVWWLIISWSLFIQEANSIQKSYELENKEIHRTINETSWKAQKILQEEKENSESWKNRVIEYKWQEYDLNQFHDKVFLPLEELLNKKWIHFDEELILKIWMIENMWSSWSEEEIKNTLNNFEWSSYLKLQSNLSSAWAKWLFQIMDWTKKWLNQKYKVTEFLNKNKKDLMKKYSLTEKDFLVIENALYCSLLVYEIKNMYWWIKWEDIAWVYNMWPKYMRLKWWKLNNETRLYIKKFRLIDSIL